MTAALITTGTLAILFFLVGFWAWWNARGSGDGGLGLGVLYAGAFFLAALNGVAWVVLFIIKLCR